MSYTTLKYNKTDNIAEILFARPDIHNAFDETVIAELTDAFEKVASDKSLRLVTLSGEGKSFCAGADLNWMKAVVQKSFNENLKEANDLAKLFYNIYTLSIPVIGKINGAAIGGGVGFVALCDIAISARSAVYSFSEVKIGVVPACISPYVIKKIGEGKARELFITGERMSAERAFEVGLVNKVVDDDKLTDEVGKICKSILSSGPEAVAVAKEMVCKVPDMTPEQFMPYTAELIAKIRLSDEGQEGMDAFLNKRKPDWHSSK